MKTKLNWFALVGGILSICLIAVSIFVPWWVLNVGEGIVKANVSPIYTDFNLIGDTMTIPLLFALNLATILIMTAGGIALLIYAVKPGKTYSKRLLGFGYSKPLFSVILFTVVLIALQQIIKMAINLDIPLLGTINSTLPQTQAFGVTVTVLISASFQWPFYLAIIVAALCLVARFYHKKVATSPPLASSSIPSTIAPTN